MSKVNITSGGLPPKLVELLKKNGKAPGSLKDLKKTSMFKSLPPGMQAAINDVVAVDSKVAELAKNTKAPASGLLAVKAASKNKLQVAAKPATNDPTDTFSKEATMPGTTGITTQEEFLSHATATPASLEAGAELPIGHPVAGSSKGAIYFVVAKAPGILVAMRWKGAQLSIRVAGPKLGDIADRLTATGLFANHMAEGYFSAHLGQQGAIDDLQGSVSAQMLYASVLAAISADIGSFTERAPYGWRNWKTAQEVTTTAA